MGLTDLVPFFKKDDRFRFDVPLSLDAWLSMFQNYGSLTYTSSIKSGQEPIGQDFCGLVSGAYRQSGIVFACELVRLMHFTEARFQYQRMRGGRPGDLFGDTELAILEKPWPGGTTGDLLARMLLHADFGGAAFVYRGLNQLNVLRPDWMTLVIGSQGWADAPQYAPDAKLLGYMYQPGGPAGGYDPIVYDASEIAMFAPIPDPEYMFRGMPWIRAVTYDVMGDRAAQVHKLKFFENGATPNMIVNVDISGSRDEFKAWVELFREGYEGNLNAYRTLFLQKAVDTKVVGSDFQQMDFKSTVGVAETRIAAAAGTPPVIVGLSEGLQGSSLNAGNYNSARRRFADGTCRPLWRNAAGSLEQIVNVPGGARLWYDDRDIQFLRDDQKDTAEVQEKKALAIRTLTDAGYEADSVVQAVLNDDFSLLVHSGLFSVQLQPPSETAPAVNAGSPVKEGDVPPASPNGKTQTPAATGGGA